MSVLARRSPTLLPVVGVVVAVAARIFIGGADRATSIPAGVAFGAILLATGVLAERSRHRRIAISPRQFLIGVVGAAVLVGFSLLRLDGEPLAIAQMRSTLLVWSVAVTFIAIVEEWVFRGALFDRLTERGGVAVAVAVTSAGFALIHVPIYGWSALPLDLAAGVWLAGIRLQGGLASSMTSHALANLTIGWLI